MARIYRQVVLIWVGLLVTAPLAGASPRMGQIPIGEYPAVAVAHHLPMAFKKSKDYWRSLQSVELEIGGQHRFRDLPELGMKDPYTGYILLGEPAQRFGVIVDIWGEEKRLYIDTNGDGSFADASMTLLLNEWHGLQLYTVTAPEPVELQVRYQSLGRAMPIHIEVAGLLNQPGRFVKQKPKLVIQVKTWFLVTLQEDGYEKLMAIVDRNNNGRFDDPEDELFIDYDDNRYFSASEASSRKSGIKIKSDKARLTVEWGAYPERVVIREVK